MKITEFIAFSILLTILVSCDRNQLPHAKYYEHYPDWRVPVIIHFKNNSLQVKDSTILDFHEFFDNYLIYLSEFDESPSKYLISLSIDKSITFEKLDSVFRVIETEYFHKIFLLVNSIKDTVGFNFQLPFYNRDTSDFFDLPDTVEVENYIKLYNDSVIINGKKLTANETDRKLREIVFRKQSSYMRVHHSTEYSVLINLLEMYNKHRQHFKELYSELRFNVKYDYFKKLPRYFSNIKSEVDNEYGNLLYLIDTSRWINKVIIPLND